MEDQHDHYGSIKKALSALLQTPVKAQQKQAHEEKWKLLLPSLSMSICLKILSVLFSGVDSSSGIFITDDTIL